MLKPFFRILTEGYSRKIISQWTGKFAKSKSSRWLIPRFAKTYGIRTEDAEKQLIEYETLNEFFTRKLKTGLRPIDPHPDTLVSPVDAVITGIGPIENGLIINVKGQDYTIEELLNQSPRMSHYDQGFYMVLYLSPTDYHRIHSPMGGTIVEKEHVRGKVYPVNEFGLRHMRRVLSRNERLITYISDEGNEVAVVKVGAMNVSSIQYVTPLPRELQKGDELAYFEFGSTVVLLMKNQTFTCRKGLKLGDKVRVGEAIGTLQKNVVESPKLIHN